MRKQYLLLGLPLLVGCMTDMMHESSTTTISTDTTIAESDDFSTPLASIATMDGKSAQLTAQAVSVTQGDNTLHALGYASSGWLGPTLLLNTGDQLSLSLTNQLTEATNLHWHGLTVPDGMDGWPEDTISTGASKQYSFPIQQRAGMYWYHPHSHGTTAKQAYLGLAGLIRVEDAEEEALALPSGENEIPLVLQDKRLVGNALGYSPTSADIMNGYLGNRIVINGTFSPYKEVPQGWIRLRILNGSNARVMNLAWESARSFVLIGTDGGLLAQASNVSHILLGPGERVDVLADFSQSPAGTIDYLRSDKFNGGTQGSQEYRIAKFVVDSRTGASYTLPAQLSSYTTTPESEAGKTRTFLLQAMDMGNMSSMSGMSGMSNMSSSSMMAMHTINGKTFNPERIDEIVKAGDTEIWEFQNPTTEIHPMHIHGLQFQMLSRTGGRGKLEEQEKGWKDTFLLLPGETVRTILHFPSNPGKFLLHCHNLEHEDNGMMLTFQIQ